MALERQELIEKYIYFFKSKKHKEIPNSSIIPTNDPTVLFTTAGMHPLVSYLTGRSHPLGKRLVNVQRCIRTGDIEEVGDTTHHTFFEMLGNWSLGDYWKEEAIAMTFEFHTKVLKIPAERYAVTCFAGNKNFPKDEESEKVWLSLGIPKERIAFLEDNWWGPAGESGPCGPDTEMFYWNDNEKSAPKIFDPKNENWVEIGNDVLLQYEKTANGKFNQLKQKNIDFGGGVERTLASLNNLSDNYLTEIWQPIIKEIENISNKRYNGNEKCMRIIADHIKATVFMLGDENSTVPSNVGQGYVLRRLVRRAIRYGRILKIESNFTTKIAEKVIQIYNDYKTLTKNKELILKELEREETKFRNTLERGIRQFEKLAQSQKEISGKESFLLFQSYGFPIEMTEEMSKEKNIKVNKKEFYEEYQKHQDLSRTTSAGKFKSGLADHSEKTTRLHTATHILNEALSIVLGSGVAQKGSNITSERTRFDFTFARKLTDKEIKEIEILVNEIVKKELTVKSEEISYKEAISSGAKGEFGHKYPEKVSVYTVLDKDEKKGYFSKEICTGPHVKNTKEIGKIKIIEQSSVSAGVRRIKAIVEN
ncbi:alanine--tRNA ligase [Candidatus Pacearchaeota archaeon]|nr:alanine--tRNA ligase [Candidatus Pacearchaeota archaeon]